MEAIKTTQSSIGPRRRPKRETLIWWTRLGFGINKRRRRERTPGIGTDTGTVQDIERECRCIFSLTAEE